MNNLLKAGLSLIIALSQVQHTAGQEQTQTIFSNVVVKAGDAIYINNPSFKPYSGVQRYEHVYTGLAQINGVTSNLTGNNPFACDIAGFTQTGGRKYAMSDIGNNSYIYIDLERALLHQEVDAPNTPLATKLTLYLSYIKGLNAITKENAFDYLNAFQKPTTQLNEFQRERLLSDAQSMLKEVQKGELRKENKIMPAVCTVGEYNIDKAAFTVNDIPDVVAYDIRLEEDIYEVALNFKNFEGKVTVPVDMKKAEEYVNKYWSQGAARKLFCLYHFDFTDNEIIQQKYSGRKAYIQNAVLKKIEFYIDDAFTTNIYTMKF